MTITTAPTTELLQEQPQTDEQAAFLWDACDEGQERALRYWVEEREMTYGQIVSMVMEYNPNSKITKRKLRYKAERMKADGNPLKTKVPKNFQKPSSQKRLEAVENVVVDIDATPVKEKEEKKDMSVKFLTGMDELFPQTSTTKNPVTTPPENNGRHQSDHLLRQPGRLLHLKSDDGRGEDHDDTLAKHWADVQASDEPESYKQAQYFLSQFEIQLGKGQRDKWSESAYEQLWRDLSSYTKSCDACSRQYREQLDASVEEARTCIEESVQRSEDVCEESSS